MLRAFFSCIQVYGQLGLHETYPWHSLVHRLYWPRRGTQPSTQQHSPTAVLFVYLLMFFGLSERRVHAMCGAGLWAGPTPG